jgi:cytochrome oxidase Cu insertion factor (SCO1/SenC/PrrC family)
MRQALLLVVFGLMLACSAGSEAAGPPKRDLRAREGKLKVGGQAPDFTIHDVAGKTTVKLSALEGKPVVLFFGSCT